MYVTESKIACNYYGHPQYQSFHYGINVESVRDLLPSRGQKSFYGKAKVVTDTEGNTYLQSYATLVCYIDRDNNLHRLWDGESRTTMNHIDAFVREFLGYRCGMGVAEWRKLEVEKH